MKHLDGYPDPYDLMQAYFEPAVMITSCAYDVGL
jgi:hypothetical protein